MYLIAWVVPHAWIEENRGVRARGLRRDGTPAPQVLALSGDSPFLSRPTVAATDRGFAVLHEDAEGTRTPLVLTRIGPDASPDVSNARTQIEPLWHYGYALAWNGTELVALWSTDQRLYAARATSDGVRLDAQPILVGYGQWLGWPAVTCDPTECIATWSELHLGVQAATIIGPTALFLSETLRDFGDYRSPPADRYAPTPVRTAGGFKLISSGPGGTLYTRSVLDDSLSAETQLTDRGIDGDTYSLADTPNGTVLVDSRPVFGPGYAGTRRLFLRFLSQ